MDHFRREGSQVTNINCNRVTMAKPISELEEDGLRKRIDLLRKFIAEQDDEIARLRRMLHSRPQFDENLTTNYQIWTRLIDEAELGYFYGYNA